MKYLKRQPVRIGIWTVIVICSAVFFYQATPLLGPFLIRGLEPVLTPLSIVFFLILLLTFVALVSLGIAWGIAELNDRLHYLKVKQKLRERTLLQTRSTQGSRYREQSRNEYIDILN